MDYRKDFLGAAIKIAQAAVRVLKRLRPAGVLPVFGTNEHRLFPTKPYSPAAATVFMHIPKTSGTALTRGLMAAIAPRNPVCFAMDGTIFGSFRDFNSIESEHRCGLYLDPLSLPAESDFVAGHISFATFRQRYKNGQYVTILREPASRILSHWLFWRSHSDDHLKAWGSWAERVNRSRGSLHDFLSCRDLACQVDNLYVRMLLGPNELIPENDFINERNDGALVSEAIKRLRQFAFLDVVENPKLILNLGSWLGRQVAYEIINETGCIPEALRTVFHRELTPELFELLERRTRLDLELWFAVAKERLAPTRPESLYTRTLILNAARYASLLAPTFSGRFKH
jgi:hypothetical protein